MDIGRNRISKNKSQNRMAEINDKYISLKLTVK